MHDLKRKKKSTLEYVDAHAMTFSSNKLVEELKCEIQEGNFIVYLQPLSDCFHRICGAEALIRYESEEEIINPEYFIEFYEDMNVIEHIDLFVFEKVCQILNEWKSKNKLDMWITLNFSRKTLSVNGLVEKMEAIIRRYDISKRNLIIEITETAISQNFMHTRAVLNILSDLGYRLSLDDFGVGYSNLRSIIDFPLSSIKIDKGLVKKIETNQKSRILLENIISIFHQLGIDVIAEGVESLYQFEYFKEKNCNYIQGYYIDKPMSIHEFEKKYT